jgi:hypothetical protein
VVLLGTTLLPVMAIPAGAVSEETGPPFVSLLFGRMQWVSTRSVDGQCRPLPNTVDLGTVKASLDARNVDATGIVIVDRTREQGFRCAGYTMHPGWDTLMAWHAEGWRFVSGGTHADMRTLTYSEQWYESCGSLAVFTEHGIDASGLFAYGGDRLDAEAQEDPVSTCFEFGRRYDELPNERATVGPPWWALVDSVNGGMCNDETLPCFERQFRAPTRYDSPHEMASELVGAAPDTWTALQFYRFVTGSYSDGTYAWDCTSPDWRHHFTSHTEMYCYDDFSIVADAYRTAIDGGAVLADPESVANAWGRSVGAPPPPPTDVTAPTVQITHPPDGGLVRTRSSVTITATASDDVRVETVEFRVNGNVKCTDLTAPYTCRWWVPRKVGIFHTIEASARDPAGNAGLARVVVRSTR